MCHGKEKPPAQPGASRCAPFCSEPEVDGEHEGSPARRVSSPSVCGCTCLIVPEELAVVP